MKKSQVFLTLFLLPFSCSVFSTSSAKAENIEHDVLSGIISQVCPDNVPGDVVKKIVTHESKTFYEGKPQAWPWTLNIDGQGYYYPNKISAVFAARKALARGVHRLGLGFGQQEWRWHGQRFGWDVNKALDPVENIRVACDVLKEAKANKRVKNWRDAVAYYHRPVLDEISYVYAKKVFEL